MFFKKSFEIDPYRVKDNVVFKNGDESLNLFVKADDGLIVATLQKINKRLSALNEVSTPEEKENVALAFASCIFGDEQADKLMNFYARDPVVVIAVCGQYFKERLSKIITKVQKK